MKNKKLLYVILAITTILVAVAVAFAVKGIITRLPEKGEITVPKKTMFREQTPVEAADIKFEDMDGNVLHLSDFRGKKVVINFWAVFCTPCVKEMPDFDRAVSYLERKNTVILALNVAEPQNEIKEFIEGLGIKNLEIYMDIDNNAAKTYAIDTIPRTIIIDEKGIIRYAARGMVEYDDLVHTVGKLD